MAESVYFPQIGRMLDPNSFFGRYFISEGYTFDTPVANTLGRGTPTVTDPSEEKSAEDYLNLDKIGTYLEGIGYGEEGPQEGDTRTVDGKKQIFTNGQWVLQDDPSGNDGSVDGSVDGSGVKKYIIVMGPDGTYQKKESTEGTYTEATIQAEIDRLNRTLNRPVLEFDPPPEIPSPPEQEGDPVEKFDIRSYAKFNYAWMNPSLLDKFVDIYSTNGGEADEAMRELRTTQAYKDEFPGIFREDGTTLRLEGATPELSYITNVEAYKNYFMDYNLNPELFENKIVKLFENDVAPEELQIRLDSAYTMLFPQFDAVKRYLVRNYPQVATSTEDISDEAIFASFIDQDISKDIIERRISIASVGGAFEERNVTVSLEQAQRLYSAGIGGQQAQRYAARAETQLPRLQRLARKYRGREDIFGVSEFLEAEVFEDTSAQRLQEQLEAEQRSAFSVAQDTLIGDEGVIGLQEI